MSAVLLAFDTSTETLSVALQWPGGRQAWDGPGGALSSSALLPRIRALMDEAGIGWSDVSAIAFGRGPGAFTGLRTACAVAQGLAFGAGLPVLPIDSLMIVAEDARRQVASASPSRLDVAVAMDARMGELYAARYRWDGARWAVACAPRLCAPGALPASWEPVGTLRAVRAGSGLGLLPDGPARAAGAVAMTGPPQAADRAAALLRLAQAAWDAGEAVEAAQALPVYLRDKVALTTAERAAQAADRSRAATLA
jgi:tRNA threonylcarbamoyladenosine biosynthesis protein TsaB